RGPVGCLGQPAVPAAGRRPAGAGDRLAGRRGAVRRRRGAGTAALGRLQGGTGDRRVLAGPHEPAARPAPVPPDRRTLAPRKIGNLTETEAAGLGATTTDAAQLVGAAPGQRSTVVRPARWRRIAIDVGPLRHYPAYRRIFIGNVTSFFGSQLTAVAVPVQM